MDFKETWLNSHRIYLLRFWHRRELSRPPCGPRTETWKTLQSLWIWPPPLSHSPKPPFLIFFFTSSSLQGPVWKLCYQRLGPANRTTEEVEKYRHSGLWNLNPSLSELCMSPENKALYSLQSWWQGRWLPDFVLQVMHSEREVLLKRGLERRRGHVEVVWIY